MRQLPAGLQAHLDTGATTLCWCWKLTRRDTVTFGFTDHDRDVSFAGATYEAASGFTASEIHSSLGLAVDNLDVEGALSSNRMTEADILAGLYDDAEIEIWRVNWQDVSQRLLIRKGNLGEVTRGEHAFSAELRGLAHRLGQPQGRLYQYTCDAEVGDSRCGVDLNAPQFKGQGAVVSSTDRQNLVVSGLNSFADAWFDRGKLTFTDGDNDGLSFEVKRHRVLTTEIEIILWRSAPRSIGSGDTFDVTAGCDKQIVTCKAKFANVINFRGFPHMPSNDFVIAYPNKGDPQNDGGSDFAGLLS